ncbi:DsbA family oxidoreductase [Aquihabitans sp. G128]|uniref:DsbA family oxidoreductase n=1 Tax=Aquihabitans sp. G128 TaxID=2849779 RepID=UPI001C249EF8|nr:DsbA family oxidoreductase [Aquihabitans sp. G128]QXC62797.1 DsbA family oxidoreductase [Aquihabitans sp. G128]
MQVDVWSDVVCPWCYVGLANLDAALAEFEHADDVELVLHSFQLDPGAPPRDDQPVVERLAEKYGTSVGEIRAGQARLVSLGAERGIDFRFDQAVGGNTFDAHRLLHLALARGLQLELKHRLGLAYFTNGEPIGEPDTLRKAAVDVGLDPEEVDAVLAGDAFAADVRQDLQTARQIGISGVPFFVADQKLAVSGAQPPEVLLDVLRQAWDARAPQITQLAGAEDVDACGPDGCEVPQP